jgi:hypothetical protein
MSKQVLYTFLGLLCLTLICQGGGHFAEGRTRSILLAMTDNPSTGGAVAIDRDGGIYIGQSKIWTRVGNTPSAPAGIWSRSSTGEVFIALQNGDLYRLEANRTLTLDSNVFTAP